VRLASPDRQLRRYGALCFHVKGETNVERYDLPELIELEVTLLAIEETEK